MTDAWTVRRVLAWTADDFATRGLPSARLDADLLAAHALGIERVALYLDLDRPLAPGELAAIRALVGRRRKREPVAYILGHRELYGRRFAVTPAVLVPRPETETLIDRALEVLPSEGDARALDLCTGSGCIAVSLACERPALVVDATEISADAAVVARGNVGALGVADRVRVLEGDLFAPLPTDVRYALVVANPPYVAEGELASLDADVREFEPHVALVAGADGLAVVRRIAAEAPRWLAPSGTLLVEVGRGQADAVLALFEAAGLRELRAHRDLAGIARVVEGRAG